MKYELKDFQHKSAYTILRHLDSARAEAHYQPQAVVLSAPTGSGKTITIAAVIDWLLGGADGVQARPQTTFLWLSDSPELNLQSRDKLLGACDNIPFHHLVPIDSDKFRDRVLAPGHVYFINTQLLGKDKLLAKSGGDLRPFTFFDTVARTIERSPQDFILIIDEAHRGAGVSERSRTPIMQKFIKGSPEDGLPPVPIVLGMSATPQRFQTLIGTTERIQRPINITPDEVRSSGLLKDQIVVTCPKVKTQSDLTMLETAAKRWREYTDRWQKYSIKENEKDVVRPILVVQVADGHGDVLTQSPMDGIVQVLERQMGHLGPNEIVHCFQEKREIEYGGRIIRNIEPSRIQDSPQVKVVIFKTALSTGWDCPRAEVMMSFRRATDPTNIAQLVGRMIRTPLARRIESDEALNSVELFLPYYDADNLERVLDKLRSPDAEEGVPVDVVTESFSYPRNPNFARVFEHLATLPTYSVNRAPRMSDIKRVLRLAGLLVVEGIDTEADERIREILTGMLKELRDESASGGSWEKIVQKGGEIDVEVLSIAVGSMNVGERRSSKLVLSDENIEQLFDAAGRSVATGEGVHRTYWKRFHDHENPNLVKLELAAVINQPETISKLSKLAKVEFDRLYAEHKASIRELPASVRSRFLSLRQSSGRSEPIEWELPETVVSRPVAEEFTNHLFADEKGKFSTKLNSWEREFLEWAMTQNGFVAWLRNVPRKDWALCIPYDLAGEQPFYPDFVIIRDSGGKLDVDILEPHDDSRKDTWAKVRGMARFAEKHHIHYGRMIVGRKSGGRLQIIDVSNASVRRRAIGMQSPNDLDALFEDLGS